MEEPNYTKQLLLQLNQQRSRGYLCDVIIVVENALFRAHKNVLGACSGYFKPLLLHDNLITLDTEMVKPSVFRQVLDFIYTGQLALSYCDNDQEVPALLRAASYLQLSDLAALCRRKLKSRSWSHLPSSTTSPLTPNSYVQDGHNYYPGSLEVGQSSKQMEEGPPGDVLPKEEILNVQDSLVNSVEINDCAESGLRLTLEVTRKSPTGRTARSLQQSFPSSSNTSSDDKPFTSRLENFKHMYPTTDSQQTAAHIRPRSSRKGSVKTKKKQEESREFKSRVPSVEEDQAEVREEDLCLKNELQNSEECGSENEEMNAKKHTSYIYHQPQLGIQADSYMCVACRKSFPSSEQLITHVESHTAEDLRIKVEEGSFIEVKSRDSEYLSLKSAKEEPKTDLKVFSHVCSVCSKIFIDVALLRQHERSHWISRPFGCNICGKLFTQRGTMTRHMRSHLGLKPFACEECGMRFTRQYRKMEHMRIHSREKPHECHLCGARFTQQRSVISHLKMHTMVPCNLQKLPIYHNDEEGK